ncbi:MAG: hypothetical protein IPM39_17915 [Chloroflexi bacterium]|nr:hypothetical protein [Chloroflexota bacterium]
MEFDADRSHFAVDCLQNGCALVISVNQRLDMAAGEGRIVERDVLVDPGGARYERYAAWLSAPPLPTRTPSPAPDSPVADPTTSATPSLLATPTAATTPDLVIPRQGVFTIGRSVRGAALEAVRLGNGRRQFILVGGIHAGYAPNTVQLADQLIAYFSANPTAVPADVTLTIIPSLNPDAAAATSRLAGRLNANGVDLNRNADCRWLADPLVLGSVAPGAGGAAPFSEPESQALRDFINQQQPTAVLLLAAHGLNYGVASPGACLERSLVSVSLAKVYGRASGYRFPDSNNDGIVQPDLQLTGDLTNWLDGSGIPAIAVLLPKYEATDFELNLAGITAVLTSYNGPEETTSSPATPTAVCGPAVIAWPSVYSQHQTTLGCARNETQRPAAATQRYANGRMIWRGDSNEVYVLYADNTLAVYGVSTAAAYQETAMLKGAFGQVWHTRPGVSQKLGEPQEAEYAINDMVIQDFQAGALFNYTGAGGVFVLLTGQNRWLLAQE